MGPGMILTTTGTVEGKRVEAYLGVVFGEAIVGANIFRDLFASIRDIVGGRSGAYEAELRRAREMALSELAEAARQLGANAVIGIDVDYEVLGQGNSMLMVTASGTAVRLAP
ncbi:hypothetical protein TCCBUS3UF1_1260 [Thermus sp. CCB_US3_UF1]|nr:hypothetical protein TCCBUS3UF1_1260 [Thermus sp. CCB_US3_UF1]